MKAKAIKILTFAVKDLVDTVTKYEDLVDAWKALKNKYKSRDLAIVLNLNYKLSILKFHSFSL